LPAEHVRHAVAIDEHRVKFKVALLAQDLHGADVSEDVKEVWFPGNHGDIGGGWSALSDKDAKHEMPTSDVTKDPYQLSDIALKWMIEELDQLPKDQPKWNSRKHGFIHNFNFDDAIQKPIHDTMKFTKQSWFKPIMWWFMEYVPLIKRWEYYWEGGKGTWKYVSLPLNRGGGRDIPPNAKFHRSVLERMTHDLNYKPTNDVFLADAQGDVKTDRKLNKLRMVAPAAIPAPTNVKGSRRSQKPLHSAGEREALLGHLQFEKNDSYGDEIYTIVKK